MEAGEEWEVSLFHRETFASEQEAVKVALGKAV